MRVLFTILILMNYLLSFSQTIASWNFTNTLVASGGISANALSTFSTSSEGTISYLTSASGTITSTPYVSNTGWSMGANWETTINTVGYQSLMLSYKQRSSGTGPRDWVVLVNGNQISSYSLSGTTGVNFGPLDLGTIANNNPSVTITFQVSTSTNVNGTAINASTGTSGLDDVVISGTVLPVEFSKFKAQYTDYTSILKFSTASETNNDYFTIERSGDGSDFETIDMIDGAGNSSEEKHYEFTDRNPLPGINYYRIKQTDYDGQYSYSEIRSVRHDGAEKVAVSPRHTDGRLDFMTEMDSYDVVIYSTAGQEVSRFSALSGHQSVGIESLQAGIYFIKVVSVGTSETVKIVKY